MMPSGKRCRYVLRSISDYQPSALNLPEPTRKTPVLVRQIIVPIRFSKAAQHSSVLPTCTQAVGLLPVSRPCAVCLGPVACARVAARPSPVGGMFTYTVSYAPDAT